MVLYKKLNKTTKMTAEEFNEKYKNWIEPGFEEQGLEFDVIGVTNFLDAIFKDLTKIPSYLHHRHNPIIWAAGFGRNQLPGYSPAKVAC